MAEVQGFTKCVGGGAGVPDFSSWGWLVEAEDGGEGLMVVLVLAVEMRCGGMVILGSCSFRECLGRMKCK